MSTSIAPSNHRSTIRRALRDVRSFIAITKKHDGRYIRRMNTEDQNAIQDAAARHLYDENSERNTTDYWPHPGDTQRQTLSGAYYFTLQTVRNYQERFESIVRVCDHLESHNEFHEYLEARDAYRRAKAEVDAIARKMTEKTGDPTYMAWEAYFGVG